MSEMYYKVGDTFEMIATKPINKWEFEESFFEEIELQTSDTLKGKLAKSGTMTIKATDTESQKATKTIIVKERGKR